MSDRRRTRRSLTALVVVAFVLGLAGSPAVVAQADGEQPDVDQFGGFIASGRGNGLQLTYDSPGLLPTGSPIFQLSVPEALATLNSGPVGYALSSFAYPGPLVADLGAALAAGGQETGIPPYPVRSEAFFPSGPTESSEGDQGTEMRAVTEFADSRSFASFAGLDFDPAAFVGSVRSNSQSVIEGTQLVSRNRTEVSDVTILGGLIEIESVVTDLVATSNGERAATAGGTTVSGMTVLGLPATVDENGVSFTQPPEDPNDGEPGPVDDPLGGALGGVGEQLGGVSDPLNDLLDQIGAGGDDALQQLFEQSGIEVELLDPIETVDGSTAERTANGLSITVNYDGSNTPVLTQLLSLVPSENLPSDDLGPIPFSPQAIFNLFKETHINGFAIAPANVFTAATPAFTFEPPVFEPPSATPPSPSTGGSTPGGGTSGGFETATPQLPAGGGSQAVTSSPVSTGAGLPFGDALPALALIGALLGSPFFAAGSRKLADNTLAAVSSSCPEGLETPPAPEEDSP